MRCPSCYGRVEKQSGICTKCGFNTKKLKDGSNKKAKELILRGDGDLVLESNVVPNDVSKKNLLLLCGFLGLFGAHYFYVGKVFRGWINFVVSIFANICFVLNFLGIKSGALNYVEFFITLIFCLVLIRTIFDFVNIIFNKFKIPVYIEEKKKK